MSWLFNALGLIAALLIVGALVALMIAEARTLGKNRGVTRRRIGPRRRKADQARREADLLRKEANHAMTSLSVDSYEKRLVNKARLEAAVARLEGEAIKLDEDEKA